MSFLQTAASWLKPKISDADRIAIERAALERASTEAIPFHPVSAAHFGPGIADQPTHEALILNNRGIAETATRAIAARVSTLNPQVKVRRRKSGGGFEVEVLHDHPLKRLLDHPHPDITRAQMLRLIGMWVPTVGESYWLKVGSGLNVPIELHPIPPGQATPLLADGVVAGYELRDGTGSTHFIERDCVVRFYLPNPANPWASKGYLGPEAVTADSLNFAGQHLRSHYENDATPKTYIETSADAVPLSGPEDEANFAANWRQRYHSRSGSQRGVPGVMPTGYTLKEMRFQSGADLVPLLEFWRDEQLMGFGTPRSILGQSESGDRSTAETNQYVFDRHAVKPVANLIADALTLQLAPDFDPAIFIEFEEFVSADKEFELKQEESRLKGKVVVINEVRKKASMEPADWGDEPAGTFADAPYRPDARYSLEESSGSTTDDPRNRAEDDRPDRVITLLMRATWERQVNASKTYEPPFIRALRKIFKAQRDDVLSNLEDLAPRARVNADDIFDPREWDAMYKKHTEPVRVAAFEAVAVGTLAELGDVSFVFTEEVQKAIRLQGAEMVKHIGDTTKADIARELHAAVVNGESSSQVAKRIRGVFSQAADHRARAIARTEIGKASTTAQLEGFDQSGVVEKKQWNHSLNPEGRIEHVALDGEIVGKDEYFSVGGEAALGPRVGLSAGNTINCQCFLTPVLE